MPNQKRYNIRNLITPILILSVAVYFLVICVSGLSGTYIEDGWKTTKGVVLSEEIELTGRENIQRVRDGFEQMINYEYIVNGVTHRSNSVSPTATVNPDDFPEGKEVTVYYHPQDPTRSVLVRTKVAREYLYMAIVFCVFMIVFVLHHTWRDFKRNN